MIMFKLQEQAAVFVKTKYKSEFEEPNTTFENLFLNI